MNKTDVVNLIIDKLNADLAIARTALKASHEAATHSESKAENKYDTRGLEAAYLADGQRRRVGEIEAALASYRNLTLQDLDGKPVVVGALVEVEQDGAVRWLFLGPDAAGSRIRCEGSEILVISPRSPLGQALLGHGDDEELEVAVAGRRQHCVILRVC